MNRTPSQGKMQSRSGCERKEEEKHNDTGDEAQPKNRELQLYKK